MNDFVTALVHDTKMDRAVRERNGPCKWRGLIGLIANAEYGCTSMYSVHKMGEHHTASESTAARLGWKPWLPLEVPEATGYVVGAALDPKSDQG